MQLMIFEPIQEEHLAPLEEGLQTLWCDHAPRVGELVALGQEKRWQVLEVKTFTPRDSEQPLTAIHNVLVARADQPVLAREAWSPYEIRALAGTRDLHLSIAALGGEILERRINYRNQLPPVGKPLYDFKPAGQGTQHYAVPRPWQVSHYELYGCQDEAPYGTIYLTFCKAVVLEEAIAA
ncbi:MAG: hypothetical protein F6K42_38075 [Leptolyngbya sp. SIO1D8]|nr:hypothetical protein [Leptolyngbya sp. SIO1D8]